MDDGNPEGISFTLQGVSQFSLLILRETIEMMA